MSQHYSDPKRESEAHSLPNIEVFEVGRADWRGQCPICESENSTNPHIYGSTNYVVHHTENHLGWYWWSCSPGCLPDSDPMGPFDTEAEALKDAREGMED